MFAFCTLALECGRFRIQWPRDVFTFRSYSRGVGSYNLPAALDNAPPVAYSTRGYNGTILLPHGPAAELLMDSSPSYTRWRERIRAPSVRI